MMYLFNATLRGAGQLYYSDKEATAEGTGFVTEADLGREYLVGEYSSYEELVKLLESDGLTHEKAVKEADRLTDYDQEP